MNKQQIKAELRRSACEDDSPWECATDAFLKMRKWKDDHTYLGDKDDDFIRIFFLLVAEAL